MFRAHDKAISIERLIRTLFARDKYPLLKLIVLFEEIQLGLDSQRLSFLACFFSSIYPKGGNRNAERN